MMKVDILNNREEVLNTFKNLDVNTKPLFGKMGPQHVVEHLAFAIGLSIGKGPGKQFTTLEEGEAVKAKLIHSEMPMPEGIKNPMLGDEPPELKCADMNAAVDLLKSELESFDKLYKENSATKMIHPRMGALDHKEWTTLHNKHFTHHLKQFGLIK
jgi:hypothetical protein